eukprot:2901522-Amphidinium_carterae.1
MEKRRRSKQTEELNYGVATQGSLRETQVPGELLIFLLDVLVWKGSPLEHKSHHKSRSSSLKSQILDLRMAVGSQLAPIL